MQNVILIGLIGFIAAVVNYAYNNKEDLQKRLQIPIGYFALIVGLGAMYAFCAVLSINTKWIAIAHGSTGTVFSYIKNGLELVLWCIPTDVTLHMALPTSAMLFCMFLVGEGKNRQGNTVRHYRNLFLSLVGLSASVAGTLIDYNRCHSAGDLIGYAQYDKATETDPEYIKPILSTAVMQATTMQAGAAAIDPNLDKLAKDGNAWAGGKAAAMRNSFQLQQQKMQVEAIQATAKANAAVAAANEKTLAGVDVFNDKLEKAKKIKDAKAERKLAKTQSEFAFKSLISSVGQFSILFALGIIGYLLELYKHPQFAKLSISVFSVGTEPELQPQRQRQPDPIVTTHTAQPLAGATVQNDRQEGARNLHENSQEGARNLHEGGLNDENSKLNSQYVETVKGHVLAGRKNDLRDMMRYAFNNWQNAKTTTAIAENYRKIDYLSTIFADEFGLKPVQLRMSQLRNGRYSAGFELVPLSSPLLLDIENSGAVTI